VESYFYDKRVASPFPKVNPDAYLSGVAMILNNLGVLYRDNNAHTGMCAKSCNKFLASLSCATGCLNKSTPIIKVLAKSIE
jgi:hypothetical protein